MTYPPYPWHELTVQRILERLGLDREELFGRTTRPDVCYARYAIAQELKTIRPRLSSGVLAKILKIDRTSAWKYLTGRHKVCSTYLEGK